MKLKVQMIGVDLDGTLLTTDKKLLPYTASVLKAAAGQGKIVLPVTGRPLCGVPEELLALHGNTVCDFGKRREDRGPEGGEAPA